MKHFWVVFLLVPPRGLGDMQRYEFSADYARIFAQKFSRRDGGECYAFFTRYLRVPDCESYGEAGNFSACFFANPGNLTNFAVLNNFGFTPSLRAQVRRPDIRRAFFAPVHIKPNGCYTQFFLRPLWGVSEIV